MSGAFTSATQTVSIHAPAGGATTEKIHMSGMSLFQSTHPQGVRQEETMRLPPLEEFQSTHPQGVRRDCNHYDTPRGCFNPRTRRGCDYAGDIITGLWHVSIHAPAGGATLTPARLEASTTGFNPRTRRGCDIAVVTDAERDRRFNPRTRRGCDASSTCSIARTFCFNPRTRRGCDLTGSSRPVRSLSFNPRTRRGCDPRQSADWQHFIVSIHAPAGGATCLPRTPLTL